eukprot:6186339-Pleurochrysis_carterae.AAC.1
MPSGVRGRVSKSLLEFAICRGNRVGGGGKANAGCAKRGSWRSSQRMAKQVTIKVVAQLAHATDNEERKFEHGIG